MHDIDFREQGDIPGVLHNSITKPNLCLELNGIVFFSLFFPPGSCFDHFITKAVELFALGLMGHVRFRRIL